MPPSIFASGVELSAVHAWLIPRRWRRLMSRPLLGGCWLPREPLFSRSSAARLYFNRSSALHYSAGALCLAAKARQRQRQARLRLDAALYIRHALYLNARS